MLHLFDEIVRRCESGEPVAVCTLVAARGSTPQKPPAMMVVLAGGQAVGTIGGGCVEAEVRTRALRRLAGDQAGECASLHTFQLNHVFGWDDGLVCGGTMEVAVQCLTTPADAAPFRKISEALSAGLRAVMSIDAVDEKGELRNFEHTLDPRPVLLIAGAGHVGAALAGIAPLIGFSTVVIDDRPDLNNPAQFPDAACILQPIEQALASWAINDNTYVVIVTRGHKHDAAALAAVVRSPARYIGLIGSKRKVLTIYEDLLQTGIPLDHLKRIHAPIGLNIQAVTPGEIAVSIAAELIAVRRQASQAAVAPMQLSNELLDRLATK